MAIDPKWLKIRDSNVARVLPGTVPTECLKNHFDMGRGHRHMIP